MLRMDERQYCEIKPLLSQTITTTPTIAWAIVGKYIDGEIYTNTNIQPRAALLGTKNGTYFVCGEPHTDFIDDLIIFYNERKNRRFTIFSPNKMWDEIVESFTFSNTSKMKRKILVLNEKRCFQEVYNNRISSDFEILPISKDYIFKSSNFNEAYYNANWGSVERFLKYGIGFCAVNKRNEIVSECTTIFMNESKANIDIYTTDKARGEGLAFHLSKVFIDKCLQTGISPVWDCDCENEPSFKLANKIGFDKISEYHLFYKSSNKL